MKWFEGDIPRAIQQAKLNKSVFIVFITGEDDSSVEMESYLHTDDVTAVVEGNNGVAVKLLANSNDCKFFSQIYPVVVIPSTFFIADTGLPLEVIAECKSHEDFLAKVKNAVEMQKRATSSQASHLAQQPQASTGASPVVASAAGDVNEDVDGAVAATRSGSGDDEVPEDTADTEQSLEDKVERAKQLVEKKREEKVKNEAEEERRREVERRTTGRSVQKLHQQQREMEMLEAKMELKKDREEEKLARKRVKEEIERDRAEKAARFNKEKDEKTKLAEEAKKKKLQEQQAALAEEQARRSDTARIQFRMPDGSSVTQQFSATDTFASVHQFITQHVGSPVTLSRTFPRRTFTTEDQTLTLQELQLAPSAAIMVIPGGVSTSVVRSSSGIFSFSGITGLLLAPVYFVWNIIGSLLGLSRPSSSGSAPAKTRSAPTSSARGGDRDPGRKAPSQRFHNAEDDSEDEDRATWNGNSTQQM
ncbi:unnamed protein product [Candidula unifasciata]|uniref:UBX domain-containing protein 4 n=1 Tax=Candidula unifasciata TaxID=100452 RepID=A0A8S3Z4A8_9EUPU|nr:unnamed protein product [Candidula unifasciata]